MDIDFNQDYCDRYIPAMIVEQEYIIKSYDDLKIIYPENIPKDLISIIRNESKNRLLKSKNKMLHLRMHRAYCLEGISNIIVKKDDHLYNNFIFDERFNKEDE